MSIALIGYTGFVGSTLLRQHSFDALYNSKNIEQIVGQSYDTVVCAGASAKKWLANKDPTADRLAIDRLMYFLQGVKAKNFVLISTVDVFKRPIDVDESSPVDESGLHAYGLNRRVLERFVENTWQERLIVRLPGLVGPGLQKNVIYDMLNGKDTSTVHGESTFQFYPMVNLKHDIDIAWQENLKLVHLTAEPLRVVDIATQAFGKDKWWNVDSEPVRYDFRSHHAGKFGGGYGYQYSKKESLLAIRAYAQGEPLANAAVHI